MDLPKLLLAILVVCLGVVAGEDAKQSAAVRGAVHHHQPHPRKLSADTYQREAGTAPNAAGAASRSQGDGIAGDKATAANTPNIFVDAPAPALGQSYNIPVLRRTMPWPEGTTLAQLAAQAAAAQRQAATRALHVNDANAAREHVLARVRARLAPSSNRRRRAAPAGQSARTPNLNLQQAPQLPATVQAEPLGGSSAAAERVDLSFTGLIAFNDTNAGNYFVSTPPDQGLCVGNGFILETVNCVMRVYSDGGSPITQALTLNAFAGYGPDRNATSLEYGPAIFDPSCWYDTKSRRWFHLLTALGVDPISGDFTGESWLDVAVSSSTNPTGAWLHYRVPTSNNGAEGTPDLKCDDGACYADFPQMAVWDQALVLTFDNKAVTSDAYYGPVVYALDKEALVQGLAAATTILINPGTNPDGTPLLNTLIPARQFSACKLRNEFLMSTSPARFISNQVDTLQLLRLRGTASLSTATPAVTLEWVEPGVKLPFKYAVPPAAIQKPGVNPLGITVFNAASGNVTLLDAGDGRMGSVAFGDDVLYAAWGTAVQGVAGAAWALVDPQRAARALDGDVIRMPRGNHLLYPYLAVRAGGEGVMALSVSGPDYFPSPAYALLTQHGVGRVKLLASGVGPLDDFEGYQSDSYVAHYGDYAAALVDEAGAFWVASMWVGQACSAQEFVADPTCGGTRNYHAVINAGANWATRVSKVVLT